MVSADEHILMLSRQSIVAGPALIEFLNRGEDPHDLRLRRIVRPRRVRAPHVRVRGDARPAGSPSSKRRLPAGATSCGARCPGHEQLGMRAKLRVKRARRH